MTGLSAEELARRAGTTPAQLARGAGQDAAAYASIGEITLRGVLDPVSLFRAQIRDTLPAD
jgi:hypothetical protein